MPRETDGESSHPNWKSLATVAFQYKHFVQETPVCSGGETISPCFSVSGVDGHIAYEEVLSTISESQKEHNKVQDNIIANNIKKDQDENFSKSNLHQQPQKQHQMNRNQWINALMISASKNSVEDLIKLLGSEKDVNVTDQFGWSMLMCASHAGATDVVRYLLENGADIKLKDKGGYTCVSLARRQNHSVILNLLKNTSVPRAHEPKTVVKVTKIYCEECKRHFEELPDNPHRNSTIHLFNSHPRKDYTWYGIPDSNKGFKLMIKSGWKREEGLGPDGSGNKCPPKTILKQDRKGLGTELGIARVTHFKPHDARAVELKRRGTCPRRERKVSIKAQHSSLRRKEHYLRRELNF